TSHQRKPSRPAARTPAASPQPPTSAQVWTKLSTATSPATPSPRTRPDAAERAGSRGRNAPNRSLTAESLAVRTNYARAWRRPSGCQTGTDPPDAYRPATHTRRPGAPTHRCAAIRGRIGLRQEPADQRDVAVDRAAHLRRRCLTPDPADPVQR